jgi:methionine-rich copper-binding protein CopC
MSARSRSPRSHRRSLAVLLGALLVAGSVFGLAAPASAHNYLVSSTPSSGQTLTRLPSKFIITTNEGLLDLSGHAAGFAFQIRDSHGLYYGNGCVKVTGPSMSIAPAIGAPGKYSVIWQIVSADGHIVSNEYDFTWAPATKTTPATGTKAPQNCDGKSGGTAPKDPNLGTDTTRPNANLGVVLGIGGGIVGLGIVLTIILLVVGRKKKA